jgi:hypothetical protein
MKKSEDGQRFLPLTCLCMRNEFECRCETGDENRGTISPAFERVKILVELIKDSVDSLNLTDC